MTLNAVLQDLISHYLRSLLFGALGNRLSRRGLATAMPWPNSATLPPTWAILTQPLSYIVHTIQN